MQSHNLEKKTPKQKQSFRQDDAVAKTDARTVKRLLGKG
jgi:ribosomal protein L35